MRFNLKPNRQIPTWTRRVMSGFAFIPMTIGYEMRWWERVDYVARMSMFGSWITERWATKEDVQRHEWSSDENDRLFRAGLVP